MVDSFRAGTARSIGRSDGTVGPGPGHPPDCRTSPAGMPYFRPTRTGRAQLVGRHAERARLEELARRARAGQGALVLLCGEAGVGKTRLADEVARGAPGARAARRGERSGRHAAVRPGRRRAARAPARRPGRPRRLRPAARRTSRCCCPSSASRPPASDRATLFEAVRCALRRRSPPSRALLVLDDLQWSDEATLELLAALRRAARASCRVLVVAAYRSDGLPRDHTLRRLRNELRRGGRLRRARARAARPRRDRASCSRELLAEPPVAVAGARDPRPHPGARRSSSRSSPRALRGERPRSRPAPRGLELGRRRRGPGARHRPRRGADRAPPSSRDAGARGGRGRRRRRRALRPRARRPSSRARPASPSCSSDGLLREDGDGRAAFRHALSCARRSTPTCPGCAAARCTASSPRRSRRAARQRVEVAHPLARRARRGRAPARRSLRAAARVRGRARLPRRDRAGRQALELWPEGEERRARASRRSSATRAAPSWPASWPRRRRRGASSSPSARRAASGSRSPTRSAGSPRVYELQGRPRGGARRAAASPPRRSPPPAGPPRPPSSGSRWPTTSALGAAPRRGDRARAGRAARTPTRAGRARPARARARARGRGARQARRVRGRARDGPRRARARARARPDARSPPSSTSASASCSTTSADYRRAEEALDTALELCRDRAPTPAPRSPA